MSLCYIQFLSITITIICALLIVVVLLQNGSGQGLSGIGATSMGGSSGLGARRTADLLSKATSYLGGVFLFLCVLANFVIDKLKSENSILQGGPNNARQCCTSNAVF